MVIDLPEVVIEVRREVGNEITRRHRMAKDVDRIRFIEVLFGQSGQCRKNDIECGIDIGQHLRARHCGPRKLRIPIADKSVLPEHGAKKML